MVTVIAKLKVKSGDEPAFQEAAQSMIAHVKDNEPSTHTYVLHRATSDPTQFVFYEVYIDQAALAAHAGSEAMKSFLATTGPLLEGRPEIGLFEELGGKR